MSVHNGEMTETGIPMELLVPLLSSTTQVPGVDKTGLNRNYRFQLKWQREEEGQASGLHDHAVPAIYAALPEQVGFKLDSGKGPVKVLVVDHIEKPTKN